MSSDSMAPFCYFPLIYLNLLVVQENKSRYGKS